MKIVDWKVADDKKNIRDGAIELRASVSENLYVKLFETPEKAKFQVKNDRTFWRRKCIEKLELLNSSPISGKILEIGAGSGWCSALLSKKSEINHIDVLDYDKYSVTELMPLVFKNLDANTAKLTGVIGSYNDIKAEDNHYDYIISVGAIHHSENLDETFKECERVLKPGGFLIAIEHCHPNSYTKQQEINDNESLLSAERVKNLYGDANLKIKAKDNSDHNYRISEFEASAYKAGLNILPYIFEKGGEDADDDIFKNPKPYRGFTNRTFKPYFAKNNLAPVFDNLLVICQKTAVADSSIFKDINASPVKVGTKRTFLQKATAKIKRMLFS
ncbi:MAG: methyltransferase domain-containing protein [Vicingaceae bacterium]